MAEKKFTIVRDSFNRLRVKINRSFAVCIKVLAEDHPRRVERNVYAYVVVDIGTSLGTWRIRDIRIMWSPQNKRYFLRYRQWKTGQIREGQDEWLDVAGPLDQNARAKVQETVLAVFTQIRAEAKKGTLGKSKSSTASDPGALAKLRRIKDDLR